MARVQLVFTDRPDGKFDLEMFVDNGQEEDATQARTHAELARRLFIDFMRSKHCTDKLDEHKANQH